MDRGHGDGSFNDLPWASVFDPAANARVLSAIQAEGFRAASELVDRFARIATTGGNGKGSSTRSTPLSNEQRAELFGATDFEPLMRSWWSMFGRLLLGSAWSRESTAEDAATLDFAGPGANGTLDLTATAPGVAVAEVWLHNKGPTDFGEIRLRCGELLADHGGVLGSAAVSFTPDAIAMPGRSSRGIDVRVTVPDDLLPGVYRGVVLVAGHPQLWLPVALTVRPSAS